MARRSDVIGVVEAAYEVERGDQAWLEGIRTAVEPQFPKNRGMGAYLYDVSELPIRISATNGNPGMGAMFERKKLERLLSTADEPYVASTWRSRAFGTASQGKGFGEIAAAREIARKLGIADFLVLNAYDPSGCGVWVGAALETVSKPAARDVRAWTRIAAHLATAFRLRRTKHRREAAVLTTQGRVEHAEGDARAGSSRNALHDAVLAMEHARGPLRRRDPQGALQEWRGLVAARWSLVDRFERGGRRYVVAVENDPIAQGPASLAPRERQVLALVATGASNKLIAYELGISDSTVRVLIARAMTRLHVATRAELVALCRAHAAAASH